MGVFSLQKQGALQAAVPWNIGPQLNQMSEEINYNKIPVHYCKTCLSLNIKPLDGGSLDYCLDCGNAEISKASIFTWEELYKQKHGRYYITL